jgi:hypothetical protein
MGGLLMSSGLERVWKEAVKAYLMHYPGICLGGLKKTKKGLSQDSR